MNGFTFLPFLLASLSPSRQPVTDANHRISFYGPEFDGLHQMAFVEQCYYRLNVTKEAASACFVLATGKNCNPYELTTRKPLPDNLATKLRANYLQLPARDQEDRKLVAENFVRHNLSVTVCSAEVTKALNKWPTTHFGKRLQVALDYLNELERHLSVVEHCQDRQSHALPFCAFLEEADLVEHCFMFHQVTPHPKCENISWPSTALPTDPRTMYIYSMYHNISVEYDAHTAKGVAELDPMAMVNRCLRSRRWAADHSHLCHVVTQKPKPKRTNTEKPHIWLMQKMHNQKRNDERWYDCSVFHEGERFEACKNLTWRD